MQNVCPRCGRVLENFNGRIGRCPQHHWVSPCGYDSEAAEQNRLDELNEQKRIEAERKRVADEAAMQEAKQRKTMRMIFTGIAVSVVALSVALYLVWRPSMVYRNAAKLLASQNYEEALEIYSSLKDHKDSRERVILCEAMIALQNGNSGAAAEKLDVLILSDSGKLAENLTSELQNMMRGWKTNDMSAAVLLQLMNRIDKIDPKGVLDRDALWLEAHAGLLDGKQTDACAVNWKGETVLAVLNADNTVSVMQMTASGNEAMDTNDSMIAEAQITFARRFAGLEGQQSLICYEEACRLAPTNGNYRLEYASELAARKDIRCADSFRQAAALGMDITEASEEAAASFSPSIYLTNLRRMQLEVLGENSDIRAKLSKETVTAITDWEKLKLDPAEVPSLLQAAAAEGIELDNLNADAVYENAAQAAAGNPGVFRFVDWNQDGFPELLALDGDGMVSYYDVDGLFRAVSQLQGISGTIAALNQNDPMAVLLSQDSTKMQIVTLSGSKLVPLFLEENMQNFQADGLSITYSRSLEGSIDRRAEFLYLADSPNSRPTITGIDWMKDRYPTPVDGQAAVIRYLEAKAYGIQEEMDLLTAAATAVGFDFGTLDALPQPELPISASAYRTEEDYSFFEASYPSGGTIVRTWIAAENSGSHLVSGATARYQDLPMDYSVPVLNLSSQIDDTLGKSETRVYRVLIPAQGRLTLTWQYGDNTGTVDTHTVSMNADSTSGSTVFNFKLKADTKKQRSQDMFVSAGVYYVTVESGPSGAGTYHMVLSYAAETNVEIENNNTPAQATPVTPDVGYSGALRDSKDVDYFTFALTQPSAVDVILSTEGSGKNTIAYQLAVNDLNGVSLSSLSVPGNAVTSQTGSIFLDAGTYLVKIEKGTVLSSAPYILTVRAEPCFNTELENNNTFETANPISVNQPVRGSFAREGDADCFTFTLDSDSLVQPKFQFTPTENGKTYTLTIFDSLRRTVMTEKIGGKESAKNFLPVALCAGTYSVVLENPRFVRQEYQLTIAAEAITAAEQEPNDTVTQATPLPMGTPITGLLRYESDNDYYKVSFPQDIAVNLSFQFPQSSDKSTAFTLSIEQNGKRLWNTKAAANIGAVSESLQFPAGEYYIRVQPSTWLGAVYTIEINPLGGN